MVASSASSRAPWVMAGSVGATLTMTAWAILGGD